ncbi:MAG TPA: response regulator [Anaerohalosphaeraceae bacterium]|jgi:DNA-binding response OmpR family regulator|nr:response regulator [Anaerohalosphaeraceae bacterium]
MFDFFGIKKKTRKIKIQVTDDEPNIVQTLKDRLEMNDFDVVVAHNGSDGLKIAEQERPDVILLDVIMPVMNGLEMLEMLRKQPWGQEPSVIMLTARSQTQDIARANACGIDDYIIKPFDLSELLEKIESILEQRKVLTKVSE